MKILEKIAPRFVIIALALALPFANLVFIKFIQGNLPFFSVRKLAAGMLVWWACALLAYLGIIVSKRFLADFIVENRPGIYRLAGFCGLASIILAIYAAQTLEWKNPLLYPQRMIEITALDERNADATGEAVEILLFTNQFGATSFSQFQSNGGWQRTSSNSYRLESAERPASVIWQGRAGDYIMVAFRTAPDAGIVAVTVEGNRTERFDLYSQVDDEVTLYFKFLPNIFERIILHLSVAIVLFLGMIAVGVLILKGYSVLERSHRRRLANIKTIILKPASSSMRKKGSWLLYAFPMIIIWVIGLMALYPGLVSADSISHFRQAWQGGYDNWHSVFYTLLVAGLTVVGKSPAVVAWFQIMAFAVGIAWGMKILDDLFCPAWVPWTLSVLMALALPNILTVITIWKDVPYTLSVFLLTLMLLRIVQTDGAWLAGKSNWLWLGLISLSVVFFRQNGLFVPLACFGILFLLYSKHWRQLTLSFTLALVAYWTFTGPVHRLLRVEDTARYKINAVILHHLAAHQAAGTPIRADDSAFLNMILPPAEWEKYNCATVNNLFFNPAFDRDLMNLNTAHAAQMLVRFFNASPGVDLRHMMCAGALVWQGNARTYLVESAFDLDSGRWVTENSLGIVQDSRLPGVASTLHAWMEYIDARENTLIYNLTWRPANFLYIAIICWVILARRKRDYRYIYTLTPILVHSMSVFVVNFAQDFRYQYPAFMLGIYGLGFLLVKKRANDERDTQQLGGEV